MENKETFREGWSVDVASKQMTHYYKNEKSLCTLKILEPYMNQFDKSVNHSQVLGYTCILCIKKLKGINEQKELWLGVFNKVLAFQNNDNFGGYESFEYFSNNYNISKK